MAGFSRRKSESGIDTRLQVALAPLGRRVRVYYWLEQLRLTLLWGLAAAASLLAVLQLTPVSIPLVPAAWAGLAAGGLVLTAGFLRVPSLLAVVRTADALGLQGRAATGYRLALKPYRDQWEEHALAESLGACRTLRAGSFPLLPRFRLWGGPAVLAGVLLLLSLSPLSLSGYYQERRALQADLEGVAREGAALVEKLENLPQEVLPPDLQQELAKLAVRVSAAPDRPSAAAELARMEARVELARQVLDPQSQRDAARLVALGSGRAGEHWAELSRAIGQGDAAAAQQAMQRILAEATQDDALALRQGGEIVQGVELRQALRQAARALEQQEEPSLEIRAQLAEALARVAAADQADAALAAAAASLADLAQGLTIGEGMLAQAAANGSGLQDGSSGTPTGGAAQTGGAAGGVQGNSSGAVAGGSPAGAVGSGSAGNPASGSTAGSGAPGSGSSPGGSGSGSPGGEGGGSGSSPGSGGGGGSTGSGSSGSSGSGAGGSGGGDSPSGGNASGGSGIGTGGNGAGGSGAGRSGGGLAQGIAPSLLGGSGEASQVSGSLRPGQSGQGVDLPWSPTSLGALPSYREVYPTYARDAQESLARAPLPPVLENMVWQYFTSLDPADSPGEE